MPILLSKFKAAFGLVLLIFYLISISIQAAAEGGNQFVYLPLIMRPSWQEVGAGSASNGGISNNSGVSTFPTVAVAPDGTPYAVWSDDTSGDYEIYVSFWNGSSWAEVGTGSASGGGVSNDGQDSDHPTLAIAPDGTPYVAWVDESFPDEEIFIRAWNGSSWAEVGPGSASGGGVSNNAGNSYEPSLVIAPDGTPYLAWADDGDGEGEIFVKSWNGNNWVAVGAGSAVGGGISNNNGHSGGPSLAITADGTPFVAWHDLSSGDYEIYLRVWNGGSWAAVGTGSASGGGISDTGGYSTNPSLAIAPDGTPYVAWSEFDGGLGISEIYVRTWNGSSWAEVGTGSASGGGISNNSGDSMGPSLLSAADGTPYVAWEDDSGGGSNEIYVRAWNGSSWVEVGAGSASGEGISNTGGYSGMPSLAISLDGTLYAAWEDGSSGDFEIYVKRYLE